MLTQDVSNTPIVSFIVPVYKVEPAYLRECLDSIAAQTMKNIEIICVNNGSPDNSNVILTEYAATDSRFRVITLKENRKSGGGRNAAYPYIRGKYVQFVDCDDIVSPRLCERAVTEAEQNSADVVVFDYYSSSSIYGPYLPAKASEVCFDMDSSEGDRIFTSYTLVWERLWKTEFILSNQLYFPEDMYCEDIWFVWQALASGGKFIRIPDVLYTWRYSPLSITRSTSTSYLDVIPTFGRIRNLLNDKNCYEKYKPAFQFIQALMFYVAHSAISTNYRSELAHFERNVETIAGEIYSYLSDDRCGLAKLKPEVFLYTKRVIQKILRISEKTTAVTIKTKIKIKIKSMIKRILRPFKPFVIRCFNFIGKQQIVRINQIENYQLHLLEAQRKENDELRKDISNLTVELKHLQEQYIHESLLPHCKITKIKSA